MGKVRGVVFQSGVDRSDDINQLADEYGIPAELAVAQAIAESGLDERAERWAYLRNGAYVNMTDQARQAIAAEDWRALRHILNVIESWGSSDISFGLGQQVPKFAPPDLGDQTHSLDNILSVRETLLNDPRYALEVMIENLADKWETYQPDGPETMGRYNWPARGLSGNPNAAHIQTSWAAAQSYLDRSGVVYNPDVPAERQVQDWVCSIRSAAFMLHTIGDWVDARDLQGEMVPGLVTPELGLLDGSGAMLARFLSERNGLPVKSGPVDWAFLQEYAGKYPMMIGSSGLYHWVGVRKWRDDGVLEIANPAPAWKGIGDDLTYNEFHAWPYWHGIWIELPQEAVGEEDDLSAEERAELNRLVSFESSLYENTLQPITNTLAEVAEGKMTKAEMAERVQGVLNSLEGNLGVVPSAQGGDDA